jgi:outer membrane protein TolC
LRTAISRALTPNDLASVSPRRFSPDIVDGRRSTFRRLLVALLCAMGLCSGCRLFDHVLPEPAYDSAGYYLQHAGRISYPSVAQSTPQEAYALDPRRLRNDREDVVWDLTLMEALSEAMKHSEIIRSSGQFLASGSALLNRPEAVPSSYDPAIQESGVLYGQRGFAAALSEFDPQVSASILTGKNATISNNGFITGGVNPGDTFQQDSGDFSLGVQKRLMSGGIFNLGHDWNYSYDNSDRLFNSVYTGAVRAEFRQPLLAGAGTEYNQIAGPISEQLQGVTGVGQGIVIARINNDITLAELEIAVAGLLRDVETTYWRLALAYQTLSAEETARDEAERAWKRVQVLVDAGDLGTADEAAARETFLRLSGRADEARNNLYAVEAELRRLMGLAVNDGRVIRATDEPTEVEVTPDWGSALLDALARRPELKRQKWSIKSLELQLRAARQLTRPRLDFVSSGRINGFGDDLLGSSTAYPDAPPFPPPAPTTLGNAYDVLGRANQTGWNVGLQFSMPVCLRYAHSQVRNFELRLQKARAALATQEIEISHELAAAFRDLDRGWLAMQTAKSRWNATKERLAALQMEFQSEPTRVPVERILAAHEAVALAEIEYSTSVAEYNIALADVQYRSGKLLQYNSVHLTDAPPTQE